MTDSTLKDLRKPFPAAVVGKLPKGRDFLDYVGHAAVTDRLLTVDPAWSWEPLALGPDGLPLYDKAGGLWIRLTILGVTRLGYGDGMDPKVRIGDAIRNAAMRFGVALDLWTKGELESADPNGGGGDKVRAFDKEERPAQRGPAPSDQWQDASMSTPPVVTDRKWLADLVNRIATCPDIPALRGLYAEVAAQVQAGAVAEADAKTTSELIEERSAAFTVQAERVPE